MNPRQPAFVWEDTGASVFEVNAVEPYGDLLGTRDYEKMTTNALKSLIDNLNERYPKIRIKRTGNKSVLARNVKDAVLTLRASQSADLVILS